MKCSLYFVINHGKYRDSVGVIATRIRVGRSGVRIPAGDSPKCLDRLSGPPRLLFKGHGGSFPEVKLSGRYVNHTPATIPRVIMNERSFTLTVCIFLHGVNRATLVLDFTFYTTLKRDSPSSKITFRTNTLKPHP